MAYGSRRRPPTRAAAVRRALPVAIVRYEHRQRGPEHPIGRVIQQPGRRTARMPEIASTRMDCELYGHREFERIAVHNGGA